MSDTIILHEMVPKWNRLFKQKGEFRQIRWCTKHDEYVAGKNDHCGCEFSEGCWFDNQDERHQEYPAPECRIVDKWLEA